MRDGLDFVPLTLEEVGRNSEDGTTVLDHINYELQKLGKACLDESTDGHAKLAVMIDIKRTPQNTIAYGPTLKVSAPGKRLTGAMGYVDRETGKITTQQTDQISIPFTAKERA